MAIARSSRPNKQRVGNQALAWPFYETHWSSASYFFETRELLLVKVGFAWNESTLYSVGAAEDHKSKIYVFFFRCFDAFILPVGDWKNKTNPSPKENGPHGQ
jgi:hypothetical protein